MRLKIAIVVHGRFHAFDLARALLEQGHDVTLLTNYPRWAVARFDFPPGRARSLWPHGVLARLAGKLRERSVQLYPEAWLHKWFGRWACNQLAGERWDVLHCWSGVAEEVFLSRANEASLHLMMRGSAHIRTQAQLLAEEEQRSDAPQDRPSSWIVAREQREYALADRIVVLSTFAYDSFVNEAVPASKLRLLPLGARLKAFRPPSEVAADRGRRILAGKPLRVLYVGSLSYQKGLLDLEAAIGQLVGGDLEFRLVGQPQPAETKQLRARLGTNATLSGKVPQAALPSAYAWADLFIFPTVQDGYAAVLAQAAASGLPILTTTNCAGPDLVRDGETGWVVPIRNPDELVERLRWCANHRTELAAMADRVYHDYQPRDWSAVAADFAQLCRDDLARLPAERRTVARPAGRDGRLGWLNRSPHC